MAKNKSTKNKIHVTFIHALYIFLYHNPSKKVFIFTGAKTKKNPFFYRYRSGIFVFYWQKIKTLV